MEVSGRALISLVFHKTTRRRPNLVVLSYGDHLDDNHFDGN